MRTHSFLSSLLALTLLGLAARPAHAQSSCNADADCVKGWTCQVTGGGACASPACAPGEKCDPQPNGCVNIEFSSCVPGACHADSDCASGMVCYSHTESNCAPVACAAGQTCPTPDCTPKTESGCVPRYLLPCTTASDCGAGFQCEPGGDSCTCSGSAGGDSSDGGTPVPPPEESCTCETSKDMRCHAATTKCNADSDCTTGWTCVVVASTSDCATPAPAPDGNPQGGAASLPVCTPSADIKQCMPPYYSLVQAVSRGSDDSAASPTFETGSGSTNAGVAPTATNGNDNDTSSAGCSVSHGSRTSSTLALFGVLGLFSALYRRRARSDRHEPRTF